MRLLLCCILWFFVSNTAAESAKFIHICADCHGPKGVSPYPDMPTIAGLSATYIEETMYAYKDQARPAKSGPYKSGDLNRQHTEMITLAKAYNDEQIQLMAKYFAAQKFAPAKQPFDQTKAELGKKIHQAKCERCHEAAGSVAADDAGILSGQWHDYLKQSFEQYRDKTRSGNKMMTKVMVKLSKDEVEALLQYYASGKP